MRATFDWLIAEKDFRSARSLIRTAWKHCPEKDEKASAHFFDLFDKALAYEEAAALADKVRDRFMGSVQGRLRLAYVYMKSRRLEEAERLAHAVVSEQPHLTNARINWAGYLNLLGHHGRAEKMLRHLAREALEPDERDLVEYNLAWHDFRRGSFKEGMNRLTRGRRLGLWGAVRGDERRLLKSGENVAGKRIMICGEGGAGDEIINARFAQILKERGASTIWVSCAGLESLLRKTPGIDEAVSFKQIDQVAFDKWAPCMDLPSLLDLDAADIPNAPYIHADRQRVSHWKSQRNPDASFHIGIRWRGNPDYETDRLRSVPFPLLERIGEIPGVQLYSLQRDDGFEEFTSRAGTRDWGSRLSTWEETAAAVSALDLVISSCTSIPNLSGAMGTPTWLLRPACYYYIWSSQTDFSAWYPQVKMFKQERSEDWMAPVEKIIREVRGIFRPSWGERLRTLTFFDH